MKLKHLLFSTVALAAFTGEAFADHQYKVVRIDLPNGAPVFALRRVEHPATIAVYSRGERSYRASERAQAHEREHARQMQVGNAPSVALKGRAH